MRELKPFDDYHRTMSQHMTYRIVYKDESKLMWLLALVLFFNKRLMTRFTTNLGGVIYPPSRKWIEADPQRATRMLVHELQHCLDREELGTAQFGLYYLFPQILALLALFAIANPWWLLFLGFLLPLPAPGRVWLESRGYATGMTLGMLTGNLPNKQRWFDHMMGWNYYKADPWLLWFRRWTNDYGFHLHRTRPLIIAEALTGS